jgi:hypothetical protein
MDPYEMWWENLALISLVLVPWYPKLGLNGLIKQFVVLASSPNWAIYLGTIRQGLNLCS